MSTQPSAAALTAAVVVVEDFANRPTVLSRTARIQSISQLIDRETHLPELIEFVRVVMIKTHLCIGDPVGGPGNREVLLREMNDGAAAVLAKVKGSA